MLLIHGHTEKNLNTTHTQTHIKKEVFLPYVGKKKIIVFMTEYRFSIRHSGGVFNTKIWNENMER